jgi:hypothetical protein
MIAFNGALGGGFAGDLSSTILSRWRWSVSDSLCFETPKTNGIGQPLFAGFMALPKSKDAGELTENSEEESPRSLRFWVVGYGESEGLCHEGSSA